MRSNLVLKLNKRRTHERVSFRVLLIVFNLDIQTRQFFAAPANGVHLLGDEWKTEKGLHAKER